MLEMRRGGAGRPGQAKPMKRTGLDHAASASSRSSYVATAGFVDRYTLSPGPTPGPAAPARSTAYAPGARGSAHSHAGGTRGSLARARRLQRLGTDTMPRDRRGVPGGAAPCCPGPAKAKSESRRGSSTACPCRTTTATRHSGRRMLKPCAGATRSGRNACRARGARRATCCCTSCMPACGCGCRGLYGRSPRSATISATDSIGILAVACRDLMKDRRIDTHVFTVQPAPGLTVFTAQPAPGYMEAGHARQQRRAGHAPLPAPQLPAAKSGKRTRKAPKNRFVVQRKLEAIFIFFSRFAL